MFSLFGAGRPSGLAGELSAVPLFSDLSARELKVVSGLVHERTALAGEVIFDEGEEGQAIYVLLSGRVAICHPERIEQPIAVVAGGGIFGELALIDGGPRSAQARAVEDCRLGVMFRGDFSNLMQSHALIATKISFQLARHYAGIVRRLAASNGKGA